MLSIETMTKIAKAEVYCPRHGGGYRYECTCPAPKRLARKTAYPGQMITVYRDGWDPEDGVLHAWGPNVIRYRAKPTAPGQGKGPWREVHRSMAEVYTRS